MGLLLPVEGEGGVCVKGWLGCVRGWGSCYRSERKAWLLNRGYAPAHLHERVGDGVLGASVLHARVVERGVLHQQPQPSLALGVILPQRVRRALGRAGGDEWVLQGLGCVGPGLWVGADERLDEGDQLGVVAPVCAQDLPDGCLARAEAP